MKNLVPVIGKQTPYRIETAISKAQNVVHIWAGIFQAKKNRGAHFFEECLDFHFMIKHWVPVIKKKTY